MPGEEAHRGCWVVSQGDSVSWTGGELSARRRRGTGGTESSKINGLAESKTYDTYASSSGYSSEDDYAGRDGSDTLKVAAAWLARFPGIEASQ